MANHTRIHYLLEQYAQKKHTAEEKAELFDLLSSPENEEVVKRWIDQAFSREMAVPGMDAATQEDMIQAIVQQTPFVRETEIAAIGDFPAISIAGRDEEKTPPIRRLRYSWIKYAAASIIIIAASWFFLNRSALKDASVTHVGPGIQELVPGQAKPKLTLGNGRTLTLDNTAAEALSSMGIENDKTLIKYPKDGKVEVNTLTTPRGGQYQLVLSDGTKVWLNAVSSITYPTVFKGDSREVLITGEAYFEVARNNQMPFRVTLENRSTVEVLGTHFNINAYSDEPFAITTLLEGSIRTDNTLLHPGESYSSGKISKANIKAVMAWKNGYFQLNGASVEELMRQVSRWYDVDISYEGPMRAREFSGQLQRSLKLSEALLILEESDIHFRREGKRLIVQY